jgi:prolycopene isomerase
MVFCDRHFGGINYPVGGVGLIAEEMADGITERGGHIVYKANVKEIITESAPAAAAAASNGSSSGSSATGPAGLTATGVRLADGRVYKGKVVISNATRWDTFEGLIGEQQMPESERLFRKRYKKSPSFFSIHMGVKADVLPDDTDVHHILLEEWEKMEAPRGTLFVSMPTL